LAPHGYIKTEKAVAELARIYFPEAKIVLATWLFDSFTHGEWDGLFKQFEQRPDWVDFLLAEFMSNNLNPQLPEKIKQTGSPGGLPIIGFPEISMYGAVPWGGFGANPTPVQITRTWDESREIKSGGFLYSEGIFEDINKTLYLQLFWNGDNNMEDILREYIKYEFSCESEELLNAINVYERTITRNRLDAEGTIHNYPDIKIPWKGEQRFFINDTDGIEEACSIVSELDGTLPEWVRNSWRWRIFCLRAIIDRELAGNGFNTTETAEKAYAELTAIYHAEKAYYCVAPPTLDSIAQNRGGFSWT
jgi:hypothetical protein